MHNFTAGRTGGLPLIPGSANTSSSNLNAYETASRKQLKMNSNQNRSSSRNTNSRSGYLDYNDHYLDHHYATNDRHHLPHQYQYNYSSNDNFNDNLAADRLDYLHSSNSTGLGERVYGHSAMQHQLNLAQGRQLQEDDCKSVHQYEEPMNLIRPSGLANFGKNNGLLNSLNRKYSNLQLNQMNQLSQADNLHLEMAARKESSENSDESVLSMESDMSSDKRLTRKNGAASSSSGSGNGQSSHIYNGRNNLGNLGNTRKYLADGKDHLSELPNSSDCSLSKSNVDTVSTTVPGSSTATLEADARFMNLITSTNGAKYNAKNASLINYDNERIYGLSNNKLSNNPMDSLNYGNMAEENIYNNGSAASTTSASNVLIKNGTLSSKYQGAQNNLSTNLSGNGNAHLLNDLRVKSGTLQSNNNVNQLTLFKHDLGTTAPLLPSNNATNLITSQLLDNATGAVYHTALHSNFDQQNAGFKMLNSRFSFSLNKSCNSNQPCYWRIASLVLVLICLLMVALFAYKQATNTPLLFNEEANKPCILVDDQVPIFPPPQFLPKQQIQPNLPSYSSSSSISASSANPSTANGYHSPSSTSTASNSPSTAHSIHLPTDPSAYKEIQFNLISTDYSNLSNNPNNVNSLHSAYLIEAIALNSVIAGKFHQQSGGLIRFHLKQLPIWARLAFFARRNEPPTLTNHELVEFITADGSVAQSSTSKRRSSRSIFEQIVFANEHSNLSEDSNYELTLNELNRNQKRIKRSSLNSQSSGGSTVSIEYLEYFEPGHWFFVFINDATHEQQYPLHLNITKLTSAQFPCPNECSGHGLCEQGKCVCDSGFVGADCARNVCPVLCSGNGQYLRGACKCSPGYFGVECENKRSFTCAQSELPCSGHGLCVAGHCVCNKNYFGDDCEQQIVDSAETCKPSKVTEASDYETELIKRTNQKQKDLETCLAHCLNGRCNDKGRCICSAGYTGRFCTLPACANNCSSHGQCVRSTVDQSMANIVAGEDETDGADDLDNDNQNGEYKCSCSADWTGPDCSFRFERNCADNLDNDNDGLIDCADSECCAKDECRDSLMCLTSPPPLDIVIRKPAPSISASFYQKTKFLIEESSVQSYAHRDEYSESRVSVIRGQIVTPDGNGLTGIRISVATDPQFGFTLTRPDGWFDILVNGGAMVTLQFQRSPFHPIKHSVYTAWNEITVMQSPIVMSVVANSDDSQNGQHSTIYSNILNKNLGQNTSNLVHQQQYTLETIFWPYTSKSSHSHLRNKNGEQKHSPANGRPHHPAAPANSSFSLHCWSHDYRRMQPLIINRLNKISKQGNLFDQSLITLEDRSLSESYKIAGSNLQLVYQSSSSPAYLSVVELQLTPDKIPHDLVLVHLRVVIEGNLFTKELEAKASLRYSFAWNKRNVYKQKVYGTSTAKIYVGYEYEHCQHIIWSTISTRMSGFQMEISEFANWNLQIHHRLNLNDKIIQLGSGGAVDLQQDVYLKETFGKHGQMRTEPACMDSSKAGESCSNNLLKQPVSITAGADGSLYIGDSDLVRCLKPDGSSTVLFKFPAKPTNAGQFSKTNGGNQAHAYVYQLQFSAYDGHLYVSNSDGFQILKLLSLDNVDQPESNFEVIAGNGLRCFHSEDSDQCGDGGPAVEAKLSHPKGIVFSADNSMYFADGTSVRRISRKGVIYTIVSANVNNHKLKPFNCDHLHSAAFPDGLQEFKENLLHSRVSARKIKLSWPTQLAINPLNNLLYILDEGHVIYELTADHRLKVAAGRPAHCSSVNDLGLITSFAFKSTGDMYISLVANGLHQIKLLTTDGSLQHYLGERATDSEHEQHHFGDTSLLHELKMQSSFASYYDQLINSHLDECLATGNLDECQAYLNYESVVQQNRTARSRRPGKQFKISAITVTGDNLVHIMDSQNYQILSVKQNLAEDRQHFSVLNALTEELYLFNKAGLHVSTLNALTGKTLYTFAYDQNNSAGKLVSVADSSNNKISFVRQQGRLSSIVSANGQKCKVILNAKAQLEQLVEEDGLKTYFGYDENGLLLSKSDNLGINYYYEYDRFGRLISVIKPSGQRVDLNYRPSVTGASIYSKQISLIDQKNENLLQLQFKPNGNHQRLFTNGVELSLADLTDSNYLLSNAFNQTVHLSSSPAQEVISVQPANSAMQQSNTVRQVIYSKLPTTGETRRTQISWTIDVKFKSNGGDEHEYDDDEIVAVERALSIEGNRILSIEYDRTANREIMYNNSRRPFLMIQYDNSSRPIQWLNIETRLPLNVIYDRQGRLAGWQQGAKVSETFVYDRNGLLSEIKYPDMSSIKYVYQNEDELSGPKKHFSQDQLPANLKPTKIILRSGKEFYYKFDQKAGLKEIWTPKPGTKHQFKFTVSLGYYKLHYAPPGHDFSNGYIVYFNDQMRPIMEQHCDAYAKVLYRYNQLNGQLNEIVYGGGKVVHSYDNQLLTSEYWLEGDDQVEISYQYKYSKVPSSVQVQYSSVYRLFGFRFQYGYDSFERKTSIRASIINSSNTSAGEPKPANNYVNSINYQYNEKTGKLEQFGPFKIVDHHDFLRKQNESLISDGIATFSKVYDSINHKLKQFSLTIRDKEVHRIIYTLNANNAIVSKKRFAKLNNLRSSQTNFSYDLDEQLIEMKSEREHWRFQYDDNFNLVGIQYLQNRIEITIDHAKDRISNFGDTPYVYDERGYLVRRGEELFSYNSFGLLVSINKLTKHNEINYLYDSRGRLSARVDNFGNHTQYVYGDIKRPQLLTHLVQFNVERSASEPQSQSRPLITSYIYDDSNLLVAFTTNMPNLANQASGESGKQLYYVVCDQSGSPTNVYSQNGELVKEITRSPFGHILFDSNPSIYLPVGFHAAISEPLISIVFFGRFVYDTLVGQFLQPNYGQILNAGIIEPKYLSVYRYARNDPINLDLFSLSRTDRYDLNKWIQHQGIDLSGFDLQLSRFIDQDGQHFSKLLSNVEDVVYNYRKSGALQRKQLSNYGSSDQFDALSTSVNLIAGAVPLPNIAMNSDFLGKLTLNSMNFGRISFIKKSQLKSDQLLEPSKIERLHTEQTFGDGLGLARKRNGNGLFVTSAPDADQLKYSVYSKVLNDSEMINLQQTKLGKDLFYFVKPDTVSVSEDLSELQKFGHSVNVTINEVRNEQSDNDGKSKVDIRIETAASIINIRYGSSLKEERQRVHSSLKREAVSSRWKQVRQSLIDLKRSQDQFSAVNQNLRSRIRTRWTEKEKETIVTAGELTNYAGEYYHDVKHYPELADDASNIIFIKS